MEAKDLQKYIDRKVFLTLDSGFKYKFILKDGLISGEVISFTDKFGNPVDFNISTINFITISRDDRSNQNSN